MAPITKTIAQKTKDEIKGFINWCKRTATEGKAFFTKHQYAEMLELIGDTKNALKILTGKLDMYFLPITMKNLCVIAEEKYSDD